jgi:dTMP kinase
LFITIEGIEGSGKTTQVALLAAALEGRGCTVRVTREPGGTELGERVRDLLLHSGTKLGRYAELFLILADRAEHVESVIRPALASGTIVLCDRFADSTLAYQAFGRELPLDEVRAVESVARRSLLPELTFVLDCPVETGLARTRKRRGAAAADRFEGEATAFHERVRRGFLTLAKEHPDRIHVLDTTRPREDVRREILERSAERIGLRLDGDRAAR